MIGIYKITSPSGRIYIGQSINIKKRWLDYNNYNSKTKVQVKLWRSFIKHKVENHLFEIIEECIEEELNNKERYWQEFHDVLNGGLNCVLQQSDEKRRKISEEVKEKLRQSNLGKCYQTEQHRINTSERMKGNKFCLNRYKSIEEKLKISNTMKKISKGVLNNMYGKFGIDNPNSKIILDFSSGIFYFGIREASTCNNLSYSSLKKIMSGSRNNNTSLKYV